jgi:hypothetical protein
MKIEAIQRQLAHVHWLGGSPCAGKSSVADTLATKYDYQLYRCDDAFERHAAIVTAERYPIFSALSALSGDALWMRPLDQQIADEINLYKEEFELIIADLLALPNTIPILAEGNALLPELVGPLLTSSQQAFWMVPTPAFQMQHYAQRAWTKEVVAACTNPEQAFANWMQRDISFATHVMQAALRQKLFWLQVDEHRSLTENIELVARYFSALRYK